jgi:hypothetical protein
MTLYVDVNDDATIIVKGKIARKGAVNEASIVAPKGMVLNLENGDKVELKPNPAITITVTPHIKNGVWFDMDTGSYWMRRPDGWHSMHVSAQDYNVAGPGRNVQRLVEPKDK